MRTKQLNTSPVSANIKREFGKLSISNHLETDKETEIITKKPTPKPKANINDVANTAYKNVTGSNNWQAFLEKSKQTESSKENELSLNLDFEDDSQPKRLNNCVAMDCEMVGIGEDKKENMLARVSIVNSFGECLYDTFVKPTATVTDYRTAVSGVRPSDLATAERFTVVQKKVLELLRGKVLVGHAVHNDLIVLRIRHPRDKIRDTTKYKKFYQIGVGTPSLKKLTSHFLHVDIQTGEHNSIQDAQAAMQLYMLFRKDWEAEIKRRRHANYHHAKKKPKPTHRPRRLHKNYKK